MHSAELGHHVECHNRIAGTTNNRVLWQLTVYVSRQEIFHVIWNCYIHWYVHKCLKFPPKIALWRDLCRVTHCCNKEPNFCVGTNFYWAVPLILWKKDVSIFTF